MDKEDLRKQQGRGHGIGSSNWQLVAIDKNRHQTHLAARGSSRDFGQSFRLCLPAPHSFEFRS